MKRTSEFVLGLIGGIFGILFALAAMFVGGVGAAFEAEGANEIVGLAWAGVGFSILGIVGSVVVRGKAKAGGAMMTIAAIGGFICIFMFFIIPGILLLIGGLMGLIRKGKPAVSA